MSAFDKFPFVDAEFISDVPIRGQECWYGCQCPAVTAGAKGLKQNGCDKIHNFRRNGKPFIVISTNHAAAA